MKNKRCLFTVLLLLVLFTSFTLAAGAEEHTHSYGEWEVIDHPTCTEAGFRRRVCSCGDVVYDHPAALGHDWGGWVQVSAPSCTASGQEKQVCKRDSSHVETRELTKLPHNMTNWTLVRRAECEVDGSESRRCTTCDTQAETRVLPKTGHNWGAWVPHLAASCETAGENRRVCQNGCGTAPETQVAPALGHNWGEWVVELAADCDDPGTSKRVCLRGCGVPAESKTLPALGHSLGEKRVTRDPTCAEAGESTQSCIRCDYKLLTPVPAYGKDSPHGHDMTGWGTTQASTCSVAGNERRTCDNGCGRIENRPLSKLDHTPNNNWVTVEEGNLSRRTKQAMACSVCGQTAKTQNVNPRGISYEDRTFAYGPLASQANPSLSGSDVRLIWLDLTTDASYTFPLVTSAPRTVGRAIITVSGGSVRVSLEKNSETASLLRYRVWQAFPDAASVTEAAMRKESLPFDQVVPMKGDSAVIVVQVLSNYYTSGVNEVFSEAALGFDNKSYGEINAEMLMNMGADM